MEERNRALKAPPHIPTAPAGSQSSTLTDPGRCSASLESGGYSVPKKLPALWELVLSIQSHLDRYGTESKWWRLSTKYLGCNGPRTVPPWSQNPRALAGAKDRWPEGGSWAMCKGKEVARAEPASAAAQGGLRTRQLEARGQQQLDPSVKCHSHLNRATAPLLPRKLHLGLCYSTSPRMPTYFKGDFPCQVIELASLSKATVRILTILKRGSWEVIRKNNKQKHWKTQNMC